MFDIAWAGLSTLVCACGAATVAGNAPAGGLLALGGCVPSELPVKALVGSPEHHESGLGSNAVEGTDQQRLPLDDRLPCLTAGSQRRRAGAWGVTARRIGWLMSLTPCPPLQPIGIAALG